MFSRGELLGALLIGIAPPLFASINPGDPPVMRAPVSARATALGNVLYCDSEEGLRYNPAFLGEGGLDTLQGTYGIFYEDTRFTHASFVLPSDTIGIAGGYTGIFSRFDNFIDADSPQRGTVDVSQSLVSAAAGARLNDTPFLMGAALRSLVDRIDGAPATSWVIDAGLGYLFSSRFKAGLVAHNALSLTSGNNDDAVGIAGVLSAAWRAPRIFEGQTDDDANTLFAAARREDDGRLYAGFGWESVFSRVLALRLGWDRDAPSAGFGFKYGFIAFDIATSWRKETFLNFVTLSFFLSPLPRPAEAPPAARPAEELPEKQKPSVSVDPAEEGWQRLQNGDTAGAEAAFKKVLEQDPDNFSAAQGMQEVSIRQARERKNNAVESALSQGNAALEHKEYVKAAASFISVLDASPENEKAEKGVQASVERSARVLADALRKKIGPPPIISDVSFSEAETMARSGSFDNFDAAGEHLSNDATGKALAAWQKVKMKGNPVAQRFDPAFSTLVSRQCADGIDRASRLAAKGQYAAAIAELDAVTALPGLTKGERHRAQGMASSYRYVGSAMGKTSYDQAVQAMRQGQNTQAVTLFERAAQCGYQVEEARRHIAELKKKPAQPSPRDLSPGDVKENLARARELFRQNRLAECRKYLIRVLYVEPRNEEARKMMEEIENQ